MNLRFLFALVVSKAVYHGMRLLGRQASYLPGWFAVKLCPDYLRHIRKAETVICVTGTAGKTTTAAKLALPEDEFVYNVLMHSYEKFLDNMMLPPWCGVGSVWDAYQFSGGGLL